VARHLHRIVLEELSPNAGKYRQGDVAIAGAPFSPPSAVDVPPLMHALFKILAEFEKENHPVVVASWLHWALARIHPFEDGNGRIARLLQDYILLKARYVPSTLQPEDREGVYYESLAEADKGNGRSFAEMITRNALKTADLYLAIIREQKERDQWMRNITQMAKERVKQSDYRRFLVVQRGSNLLKNEFALVSRSLADEMRGFVQIKFRDFKSLDFEQFQQIEREGKAKRTWFFGIEIRVGESRLRYIFWFGSHRQRPDDIVDISRFPSKVAILVSVEEEEDNYRLLDTVEEDQVTLREIIPAGASFWRRRLNPVAKKKEKMEMEWDVDITAGRIVRDFYSEVLRKIGVVG